MSGIFFCWSASSSAESLELLMLIYTDFWYSARTTTTLDACPEFIHLHLICDSCQSPSDCRILNYYYMIICYVLFKSCCVLFLFFNYEEIAIWVFVCVYMHLAFFTSPTGTWSFRSRASLEMLWWRSTSTGGETCDDVSISTDTHRFNGKNTSTTTLHYFDQNFRRYTRLELFWDLLW